MEHITDDEAREMRLVLEQLYGPQAQQWRITHDTYRIFGEMIVDSGQCTQAMHLVPRPYDMSHPLKWAKRQVRQALTRYFGSDEGRHYLLCLRGAALRMKMQFLEAQSPAY